MTINSVPTLAIWVAQGLLALLLGVTGWTVNREYIRNDVQEQRIQALERCIVKLDWIADDVRETKADVKKLMSRP